MSQQTLRSEGGSLGDIRNTRKGGSNKASFSTLAPSKHNAPSEENSLKVPRSQRASNSIIPQNSTGSIIPQNSVGNPEATFQTYTDGKVKQLFESLRLETVLTFSSLLKLNTYRRQ